MNAGGDPGGWVSRRRRDGWVIVVATVRAVQRMAMTSVLLLGGVGGLVGCTSGGAPEPSPTVSSSSPPSVSSSGPSPSVTPSPSVSIDIPEAARANTPEGATAFAKWYLEQGSRANVEWDATAIRGLSLPSCKTCAAVVKGVEELKQAGQHERSQRYAPGASQVGPGPSGGSYVVDVLGTYSKMDIVDANGVVVRTLEAEDSALRVTTAWQGSRWAVAEVAVIRR